MENREFNVFQDPRTTKAPKFLADRNGLKVLIPYDPSIPVNPIYLQCLKPQEFQTIYEEHKKGLIWLSQEPQWNGQRHAFISDNGNTFYKRFIQFSELP